MLEFIAAILASLSFNLSLVLQAIDARRAPLEFSFHPALIVHLIRRPWWTTGTVLGLVALALEVYALRGLPLAFVQPLIAGGVLVLPAAARLILKESISSQSLVAATVVVLGVLLLALALPPTLARTPTPTMPAVILPAVASLVVYLGLRGLRDAFLLSLVAGVSYGATGVFSKLLTVSSELGTAIGTGAALACCGAVGFLAEMSALQTLSPTRAAPIIVGLTTLTPVVIGRVLLHENWPNPLLTIIGLGLTLLPAMWIAGHVSIALPKET